MSTKYLRVVISISVLITSIGIALFITNWAWSLGVIRYLNIAIAALAIIGAICLGIAQYNRLCAISIGERVAAIAKEKLIGEIAAGIALTAFLGMYFRVGYEMDRDNLTARYNHVQEAALIIKHEMSASYCASNSYRKFACIEINEGMGSILWILLSGDEKKLRQRIDSINSQLKMLSSEQGAEKKQNLEIAIASLQTIKLDDDSLQRLLFLLQLLLLAGGISAISRKVAIAAFDVSREKKPFCLRYLRAHMNRWMQLTRHKD